MASDLTRYYRPMPLCDEAKLAGCYSGQGVGNFTSFDRCGLARAAIDG
jgi:hypothetical protein